VLSVLPLLLEKNWQWLHLTGANDFAKVNSFYTTHKIPAVVKPFLAEMELALGAATAGVSRAGASSLAEIAAMRLPSALVPLPTAADNHQFFNASAFEQTGAAILLDQTTTPRGAVTAALVLTGLMENETERSRLQAALAQWHVPAAAEVIADNILDALGQGVDRPARTGAKPAAGGEIKLRAVT